MSAASATSTKSAMSRFADVYPLSPMQEGMLFHTLLAPDSGVYVTQVVLGFAADDMDLDLLAQSWQRVAARHAALRTFFAWEGLETPIQVVERQVDMPIERLDWRRVRAADASRRLAAWQRAERGTSFDLARAPLSRLGLIQLPARRSAVVWTFHHIILDGWSVPLVLRDVEAIYRWLAAGGAGGAGGGVGDGAAVAAGPPGLPPARPFRDYIVWLQRQDLALAESYWRGVLRGFRAPTPLPGEDGGERGAAGAAGAVAAAAGGAGDGMRRAVVPAAATAALVAWGRRAGLTVNTLAQGIWALLLSRHAAQRDVAFGAAVLGRPADLDGADAIVGLFVNTLVVRIDAAPDALLVPWLQEIQAAWARSRRFEHSPLLRVQEWSEVPRGTPLFETVLNFTGAAQKPAASDGRQVDTAAQTNVAITLDVAVGDQVELQLRWDPARCGAAAMERLLAAAATLFARLPGAAGRRLADVSPLGAAQRHQAVCEWNDTGVARAADPALLHSRFEALAAAAPHQEALIDQAGALTYGELDALATALARRLRRAGVGVEARVGVLLERSREMVVALFAVLKAGAAYLPLDPDHPAERLAFQAADGGVAAVVTTPALGGRLAAPAGGDAAPPRILVDLRELAADPAAAPLPCGAGPDNLAYVIYTSGSTGRPKGAMITHRAIVNRLEWMQQAFGLGGDDRVLQKTPFSFDVSVWEFFWPLATGARLVLAPPGAHRDPSLLLELIAGQRITVAHFVPSMLHFFLDTPEVAAAAAGLRRVICSGEALGGPLQSRFHASLPGELYNLYGPTEAAVDVTWWRCDRGSRASLAVPPAVSVVPIGRPIANTAIHLLDAAGQPAAIGAPGELHIGGAGLARGYLGRPDLTADRFVPDPFGGAPGQRLYRTGDLARRRADGSVEYLGRIDLQVKVRGIRVELGEIEDVLSGHPAVRQAAVAAWDDGAAGKRLVAYVVPAAPAVTAAPALPAPPAPPSTVAWEELLAWARRKLPEAMVPAAVVPLAALPVTASGKLDRRALPPPDPETVMGGAGGGGERAAPRDPLEEELVGMWQDILRVRPIGIGDDFFTLGGHSLLAVRLMGALRKRFGVELPLARLVEARTVERLAALLRAPAPVDRRAPLVALQPAGAGVPFFCVHPIGGHVLCYADLARHLGGDAPFYGLQAPGLEEVGAVAPSIEEMAASYLAAVLPLARERGGACCLGGWSMGGIVAFEMARQLRAAGHHPVPVAILDSWSPDIHRIVPDDAYLLAEIVRDVALQRGIPQALTYEHLLELAPEERLARVLEVGRAGGLVAADLDAAWLRRTLEGYRARRTALMRYRPARHSGGLTLFRAVEQDAQFVRQVEAELGFDVDDETLGWGAYSDAPVAVEWAAGNHSTMCQEPHVAALAGSLRAWIERAIPPRDGAAVPGFATSLRSHTLEEDPA